MLIRKSKRDFGFEIIDLCRNVHAKALFLAVCFLFRKGENNKSIKLPRAVNLERQTH